MTDKRKEYQDWLDKCPLTLFGGEFQVSELAWQACQSLNDKRIAQLLVVIAKKDEALSAVDDLIEHQYCGSKDAMTDLQIACDMTHEALALQPSDVELVEVGYFAASSPHGIELNFYNDDTNEVLDSPLLYTIKTKADKK